jgi:hypothetical protein
MKSSCRVDHGPQIGMIKPIGPLKIFLINPFKGFEMILDTMVISLRGDHF